MRKLFFATVLIGVVMSSCNQKEESGNPFFQAWEAPYELPPFDKITVEDYREAFLEGMKEQKAEIEAIVNNEDEPTFENTLVALDASGKLLSKVSAVFGGLTGAHGTPELLALQTEMVALQTQHSNSIMMNAALFKKIDYVKNNGLEKLTDPEDIYLLNETWSNFVRGGVMLEGEKADRYREVNERISVLQNQFGQNILAETSAFNLFIQNEKDLAGLSDDLIQAAAQKAEKLGKPGEWAFGLDNPSIMPFLTYAENRELRTELLNAYLNRCNNDNEYDNKSVIAELVTLRKEKANLLGYEDFPAYILEKRMALNTKNVYDLLLQLWKPSLKIAKRESQDFQKVIDSEGGRFKLTAADWRYYSNKLKAERFDLSDEMLRPYFKADNVRNGIFWLCEKLYGITFVELKDVSRPHPDAQTFLCIDKDGQTELGLLYIDLYARPGHKRSGAWCGSYRSSHYENGERVKPITTIVCNFTAPIGEEPSLLTPDETETFFHEFGHALHNLFKNVKYRSTGSVPRDFVELPSQIMEHWAFEPAVLQQYAKHYKTGEVIPQELISKMEAASLFGQGFINTEFLAAALLDMDYHVFGEPQKIGNEISVIDFETSTLGNYGLISQIPPRYRSTYFQHTFTGGYAVGYYSYRWSEVLDCDAYSAFLETGDIFNQELATKFRKYVLEPGGITPADQMYRNFRGKDPSIEPLLKMSGLN
ncbi:M3 family metallopeptidase [Bacteroidales bacterium OttesenSCG-928-A17]|nr:M3 family metallopeptidase [Bacteroidales bacterium OttesenSCG-928-A17]